MLFSSSPKLIDILKILNLNSDSLISDNLNSNSLIKGLNEIHRVVNGDITFVDHPKYYNKALKSKASVIIINLDRISLDKRQLDIFLKSINLNSNNLNGKALILSDDPFRDFVKLAKHFNPFQPAVQLVSAQAKIGKGTIIQPGAFIGNNVAIGHHCLIHSNVSIYDNCVIGNNVIIHANTVLGADAFYYKKRAETEHVPSFYDKLVSCGRVVIENHVEIGACCTIDRGVSSDTVIGWGTKLDNLIQIGHDTIIGKNCLLISQVGIAGVVTVEDDVILWGQVGVQKNLTIGKGAIVLGQSGINKSLKGGITYFGSPVSEAKKKMKELALIKMLPHLIKKL